MNSFASRKFLLSMLAELATSGLAYAGTITPDQWQQVTMVVLGSYTVGNVGEHLANALGKAKGNQG